MATVFTNDFGITPKVELIHPSVGPAKVVVVGASFNMSMDVAEAERLHQSLGAVIGQALATDKINAVHAEAAEKQAVPA